MLLFLVGLAVAPALAGAATPPAERADTATHGSRIDATREVQLGSTPLSPVVDSLRDVPREPVPPIIVPPVGYSRYDDSDPLDNEVRREVYEAVRQSPGDYLAGIAAGLEATVSTVRYHVRVLEDEGLVRTATVRGKHRVYPAATADPEVAAALNDESTARVIAAVHRHEPISVSSLADELDRARSTVSYHLARLEDDAVLSREREGESVSVTLTATTRESLGDSAVG